MIYEIKSNMITLNLFLVIILAINLIVYNILIIIKYIILFFINSKTLIQYYYKNLSILSFICFLINSKLFKLSSLSGEGEKIKISQDEFNTFFIFS